MIKYSIMKIDELISKFREFQSELSKNINMSYGSAPNMTMKANHGLDIMAMAEKAEAGKDVKVLVSDKPLSPKEVGDVGASGFKVQPSKGQKVRALDIPPAKKAEETIKYEANGQWSLHKGGGMTRGSRGKEGAQHSRYEFRNIMEQRRHAAEMDRQREANDSAPVTHYSTRNLPPTYIQGQHKVTTVHVPKLKA